VATVSKRLCSGTLTASNATLYTAPSSSGNYAIIKSIMLCNTSAVAVSVTLKFDGIAVISTHVIAAYDTLILTISDQILEASELIEGLASTTSVITYYISGKEVT
jgi:hypothetical protein